MLGTRKRTKAKWGSRGATLVEMAIVIFLLFTLVFGMIELGLLVKDHLALNQVARETARSAAVGSGLETVNARAITWATKLGLDSSELETPVVTYTDPDTGGAVPSPAPPGSEVGVTLTYHHDTITGILPFLPDTINVTTTMVMRLE